MSDHLPECYLSGPPNLCPMCEALRACEQRVEREWIEHCKRVEQRVREDERALIAVEQTTLAELNAEYRKGLDAAREAVAAVGVRKDTSHDMRVQALAAIDALRGGE